MRKRFAIRRVSGLLTASSLLFMALCALSVFAADEGTTARQPAAITAAQVQFFESKVRPVLVASCYGCHSAQEQKSGLRLDSREGMLKGGKRGPALVPGAPEQTLLLQAVHFEGALKMPPAGKLRS